MNTLPYDEIHIEELEVFANHGVFPEETRLGQKFLISLILYTDSRNAGKTDCLEKSVDYGEVSKFVTEYTKSHPCRLIEAAAEHLAEELLLR
ncbi:MAG: dihydroneopterin aldolase, partial [Oscillospiraceae bacterium]